MKKSLQEDLQAVLAKHGLKADGVTPLETKDTSDEVTTSKAGDESKVVANLVDNIAKKLAGIVADNKGYTNKDQEDLETDVKTKILTSWGGLKEIEYPSDLKSLTKEEKIVTFFKSLVFHKADPRSNQVLRALVEGTNADGGFLVPEELRTEVFRVLPDWTVMRRIARILPMSTDTLKLNSLSARPKAYWTAEYASKSTTSAEFGQVTLSPNDLVCLLPISEQLLADANINLVSFIIELFAESIGAEEDNAFFTGNGTGRPRGIAIETISTITPNAASVTFDDILRLMDQVPQRAAQSPRAAFVGHRNVKRMLRTLKDTTNNYIWRDAKGGVGGGGEVKRLPDTIYGYPFYEQNDLNQRELYFGDWSNYIIADRQTMAVTTTTEGGDAWRRNAMEIKAVERVDGRAVILSPFAKLNSI